MRTRSLVAGTAATLLVLGACELGTPGTTYQPVAWGDPESADATAVDVAAGDLDGDGDTDLVATGMRYAHGVLLNDGDPLLLVGAARRRRRRGPRPGRRLGVWGNILDARLPR